MIKTFTALLKIQFGPSQTAPMKANKPETILSARWNSIYVNIISVNHWTYRPCVLSLIYSLCFCNQKPSINNPCPNATPVPRLSFNKDELNITSRFLAAFYGSPIQYFKLLTSTLFLKSINMGSGSFAPLHRKCQMKYAYTHKLLWVYL